MTKLINMTELGVIATGDNGENVFNVDTFEDLENILQSLVKVCQLLINIQIKVVTSI